MTHTHYFGIPVETLREEHARQERLRELAARPVAMFQRGLITVPELAEELAEITRNH